MTVNSVPRVGEEQWWTTVVGFVPSDQQLEAITAPLAPGVIIAGAGTGKTTVMAARVAWLVASGQVEANEVLGLTFTRKATAELAGRIDRFLASVAALGGDVDEDERSAATTLTYDGFAGRIVDEFGAWDGIEPGARLITPARCHQIAREVVAGWPRPPLMGSQRKPVTVSEAVVTLAQELASHDVDPARAKEANARWREELEAAPQNRKGPWAPVRDAIVVADERDELLDMVEAYQRLKAERGLVEFGDRMRQALALVRHHDRIGEELRMRHRVVLLDEYQDTSTSQAMLLRGLFSGPPGSPGRGHPVTGVGDPLQAIYGWRGAAASNILSFAREFPTAEGPAKIHHLTVNRRSVPLVLDCANEVSAALRHAQDGSAPRVEALVPGRGPTPADGAPAAVSCLAHTTWCEECAAVADLVVEARSRGEVTRWGQVGVLVRRNSDVADLHAALSARDVPVVVANLGGLLTLPDIALVVDHLRVLHDRRDDEALANLVAAPRWGLRPDQLARIRRRAVRLARRRGEKDDLGEQVEPHLADVLDDPGPLREDPDLDRALGALARECEDMAAHRTEGLADLVLRCRVVSGLDADLAADRPDRARARQGHLDAFWGEVRKATDDDPDLTVAGLLAWLDIEAEVGTGLERTPAEVDDAVVISTVHGAKGLEWDLVVLPDMTEGVFPSTIAPPNFTRRAGVLPVSVRGDRDAIAAPRDGSREALEDYRTDLAAESATAETRLAYVAITRARQRLVLSWHRWAPGRVSARTESRYLLQVGEVAGVQHVGQPLEEAPAPEGAPDPGVTWPQSADPRQVEARDWVLRAVGEVATAPTAGPAAPADEVDGTAPPGRAVPPGPTPGDLTAEETALVRSWRRAGEDLVAEERRRRRQGPAPVPTALTTSQVMALHRDREAFLAQVRRPMPRPAGPTTTVGIAFHEWVAGRLAPRGEDSLFDEDDARQERRLDWQEVGEPGRTVPVAGADGSGAEGLDDPAVLTALRRDFEASPWARAEVVAVEEPFVLKLASHVVRGRLDAVFRDPDDPRRHVVVDWKTSRPGSADPTQLSVYRLAWARANGMDPEMVDAVFHHVSARTTVHPDGLLDADALDRVLGD